MSLQPRSGPALLIEDSPAYVDIYRRVLLAYGTEIIVTSTAAEARGVLATRQPSVILLDLQLPDDSSGELLAWIERSPLCSRTIVVTGFPTIGRSFAQQIPVVDKASFSGLREHLTRILGRQPEGAGVT